MWFWFFWFLDKQNTHHDDGYFVVDQRRLELLTSAMRMQRSTRWATGPGVWSWYCERCVGGLRQSTVELSLLRVFYCVERGSHTGCPRVIQGDSEDAVEANVAALMRPRQGSRAFIFEWCPQKESNLHRILRTDPLYPLSYEGVSPESSMSFLDWKGECNARPKALI